MIDYEQFKLFLVKLGGERPLLRLDLLAEIAYERVTDRADNIL
jgi:hypothetical protein